MKPCPAWAAAKAEGRKTYFTGKPCCRGHLAERRTVGRSCLACNAEFRETYVAPPVPPEKHREYHRRWYEKNKDQRRVTVAAWRESNKDKVREIDRRWAKSNRVKRYAKTAAYRAARRKAIPSWADRHAILAVYAEAHRLSRETGIPHHVDHVVPLTGRTVCGLHVADNLRAVPASVNCRKRNAWPVEA